MDSDSSKGVATANLERRSECTEDGATANLEGQNESIDSSIESCSRFVEDFDSGRPCSSMLPNNSNGV